MWFFPSQLKQLHGSSRMAAFIFYKFFSTICVVPEYSTFILPNGTPALTLRTIGGIVDLHFFVGPTPEDVTMQYTAVGLKQLTKGRSSENVGICCCAFLYVWPVLKIVIIKWLIYFFATMIISLFFMIF